MSTSDSEELKTDPDDSPPPTGRSRDSYDEADQSNQIANLQMANSELQTMLLIQRKSSILNIHKMSALENELSAYKNRLEAEKYESEANLALVQQLEQRISNISNIQTEPTPNIKTHIQNNSSSPRPPPIEPPPPVPPSKPHKKELNKASNNILSNLEDLDKNKSTYSRGRLRRRRASLPSINILPSFRSLKSVMGFAVDEEDKIDENKESVNSNNNGRDKAESKNSKNKSDKSDKNVENHNHKKDSVHSKTEKNKSSLNKKLNPKEIKQLYIKNLKLQAQIDKFKEKEKEFENKLQEKEVKIQEYEDHCNDLNDQIQLKSEVITKLNDQVLIAENSNELNGKILQLERLLVEKDTQIQSLRKEMMQITQEMEIKANDNIHSRSLTPGGYEIHPTSWDGTASETQTETKIKIGTQHESMPSAPPMEEYEEYDEDLEEEVKGMTLAIKLEQRPSWKELQERGILLADPTSIQSVSLQEAHRGLKRRRASQELDKLLVHRLNNLEMDQMMAATDSLMAVSQIKRIGDRLSLKLGQRPSMDETIARGILLYRTDTKLTADLQQRHAQLHRRKASQNVEKLMFNRPTPVELENSGILVSSSTQILRGAHKKKNSLDLEAGLKRRMSLSEMQGLGLLFMDGDPHGVFNIDEEEEEQDDDNDDDVMMMDVMDDDEHKATMNIAGLFAQKPRSSKPLHALESEIPSNLLNSNNKRRQSVDASFEPYKLGKFDKMCRIESKLLQRPSVDDMKMRGLLYEHPSISKSLVERKRDLMRRRASNKVDNLLINRPRRHELENRNILLREDETLDKRKRHKRKRSQNLENAIQRRPKAMLEKEAQRQRRQSLTDKDFKPDYLAHLAQMGDGDEDDYDGGGMHQMQEMEIRFLNVGGYVIPLVSPRFMSNLVQENDENNIQIENEKNQHDLEDLREELEDVQEELDFTRAEIKQKDVQIDKMKEDLTQLRQETSRKSLLDPLNKVKNSNNNREISSLKKELESREQYLSKLLFYLKDNNSVSVAIPTEKELKQIMKHKLQKRFESRPSFRDLQRKAILSSNFMNDVTNQNAQIAEKKLKFGRTSQKISEFLIARPSKESLKQYIQMPKPQASLITRESFEIVDNATVYELREEIVRLNSMLSEKVHLANKLEKDNETMRIAIDGKLDETTDMLSRQLGAYSIHESQVLNQALDDLVKESEENELISQLQEKNEKLQQKIRRLSTINVDPQTIVSAQSVGILNWCKTLSWPDEVNNAIVNNASIRDVICLQREMRVDQFKRMCDLEKELFVCQTHHRADKEQLIKATANEFNRLRAEIKRVGQRQQEQIEQSNSNANSSSYYTYLTGALWKK